ncbi:DedA family protein [Thermovenabulum sp.]|uniref:DedA family protein n=1 Tax=Thermovenabulum sp. TaxID=3100335 RepID=UPI003C7B50C3
MAKVNSLYEFIIRYGYAGIFLFLFYEGTGMPGPVQIIFIAAAYLIKKGSLNLFKVILYITLGNLSGNILAYFVGRFKGKRFVKSLLKKLKVKEDVYRRIERWYKNKGGYVVFISRLIGLPRTPAIWLSGVAGIDLIEYVVFCFLGDLVWATIWTLMALYGFNGIAYIQKLLSKIVH